MNKKESLELYTKGKEAWNDWANERLAIKDKLVKDEQWQIDDLKEGINQATEDWITESNVDFSGHIFEEEASFSGFIFPYSANFVKATFNGDVKFSEAEFCGNAKFSEAIFSGNAKFSEATFSGNAVFSGTTFNGDTWFNKAIFIGYAKFSEAEFRGYTEFNKVTFSSNAWFNKVIFSRNAKFSGAAFSSNAIFSGAAFNGDVKFNRALFENFTIFQETVFKQESSFVAINGQSFFSFKGAKFHFVPDFNQAHFIEAPQFDDSDFSKARNYRSENEDNLSSHWRALKRLAIQGHDHVRELLFFAEEIKSQRGIQDKAFPNLFNFFNNKPIWQGCSRFWFGLLYQYLSDFGRSVMHPLLWLLIFGSLFYIFYLKYPIEDQFIPIYDDPITETIGCERSEAAIYLSVQSALPFLPATRYSENINRSYACLYGKHSDGKANIPNAIVFISIFQTILSTILIFLSLLALRNHFRIK